LVKNVEKNCQRRPPNNHWPERADCPGGLWLLQLSTVRRIFEKWNGQIYAVAERGNRKSSTSVDYTVDWNETRGSDL